MAGIAIRPFSPSRFNTVIDGRIRFTVCSGHQTLQPDSGTDDVVLNDALQVCCVRIVTDHLPTAVAHRLKAAGKLCVFTRPSGHPVTGETAASGCSVLTLNVLTDFLPSGQRPKIIEQFHDTNSTCIRRGSTPRRLQHSRYTCFSQYSTRSISSFALLYVRFRVPMV